MLFSEKRFFVASIVPAVVFTAIIFRLFYLQVVRGEFYLERSQSNFIQERPISHSRGLIFDQAGMPLVDNRPAHDLYVTFAMLSDSQKTLKQLAPVMGLTLPKIKKLREKISQALEHREATVIPVGFLDSEDTCRQLESIIDAELIGGVVIAKAAIDGELGCQVSINPLQFPSRTASLRRLQELLNIDDDEFQLYLASAKKKAQGLGEFKPVLFINDIGFDAYARIEAAVSLGMLPGVAIFDSVKRRYIHGKFASHALGYLNEISTEDIRKKKGEYRSGQRIGRRGIEAVYENDLRGQDGVERYVVDAKGRRFGQSWETSLLGEYRIDTPIAGHSLILSLDYELQKMAEQAFAGQAGSVIALEVGTGFVLALASFPAYDPNEIVARDNRKILQAMTNDPLKPWINKAVQEHYAPGSTFKAITAVAGFEHGLLTPQTHERCTGVFNLGKASWRCFKRDGHGNIDVVEALKTSCDNFFYTMGYALGPDKLAETSRLLGFGRRTGIDLDMEIPGIIPDREFYKKRLGYYAPGFVINSAIGQGDVTVTPIQLAVAYDAILNGGTIYQPQLVREVLDAEGKRVHEIGPKVVAHLKESEGNLKLVKEGLAYVMQPGGTAYGVRWRSDMPALVKWLRDSGVVIGGKTGTAQVVRLSKAIKHLDPTKVAYAERDHAWFVGFAPVDNPEIVVVAMTEHGGFGGTASAPVVAELVRTWYEKIRGRGRYMHLGVTLAQEQ